MKYLHTLFLICFSVLSFSQAPKLINYQGLARDVTGAPISSAVIALKFEIKQNATVVFTETLTVNTNSLGLFSTQIGSGSGSNLNVNWQSGTYNLQVSMDLGNTGNFVSIGNAQPLASVPYAMHAASVPASYANSVLTIGTTSITLPTSPTPTINGGGIASVSPNTGTNFTVTVPAPTLALSSNNLSISGGNTVALPAGLPQATVTGAGQAQVSSAGTNSFNVNVPSPTLSIIGTNSISISGGNTIALPTAAQGTVTGTGQAVVTSAGTNSFQVSVPLPVLSLNSNTLTIAGGNSVPLPVYATPTITGTGLASVITATPNYTVTVPQPAYNGTVLSFGSAGSATIAPTLLLNGTVLSSGPGTNSVSLSATGPFKQLTAGTVSLTVTTDNVSLGTPGLPTAKLDVRGTATGSPVIKAINANSANSAAAVDVATDGGLGLTVTNNNTSGTGGSFYAQDGQALIAQNNGSTNNTFYATNTNASIATFAGYFKGGFVAESKLSTSSYFAMKARNTSTDLFVVRADGNVGINTNTPAQALDVIGSVKITDGQQADGRMLVSDGAGKGTWKNSPPAVSMGGFNSGSAIVNSSVTPTALNTGAISFTKQYASSEVDISLNSRIDAGVFSGSVTAIVVELYVDGAASSSATNVHYIFGSGTQEYVNLRSVFPGLTAGSHTITIVAKTNNGVGTASGVTVDPGGLGGKIIVKEIY